MTSVNFSDPEVTSELHCFDFDLNFLILVKTDIIVKLPELVVPGSFRFEVIQLTLQFKFFK